MSASTSQVLRSLRILMPFFSPEYTLNPNSALQMTITVASSINVRSRSNNAAMPAEISGVLSPTDVPTPPSMPRMNAMSMILPGRPAAARAPIAPSHAVERRRTDRPRFQYR